jgi:hypothetical protein
VNVTQDGPPSAEPPLMTDTFVYTNPENQLAVLVYICYNTGADPGGGGRTSPPPKIGKKYDFLA